MKLKLVRSVTTIVTLIAILTTGCRSGRSKLPPDHILALYAPREQTQALPAEMPPQRDLATSAPSLASGSWSGSNSTAGQSRCTSGCCSRH